MAVGDDESMYDTVGGGWSSAGGGCGNLCSKCNVAKIRKDQNIVRVVVEVVCSSGP